MITFVWKREFLWSFLGTVWCQVIVLCRVAGIATEWFSIA